MKEQLKKLTREQMLVLYGSIVAYPNPQRHQVLDIITNSKEVVAEEGDYLDHLTDEQLQKSLLEACDGQSANVLKVYIDALDWEGFIQ